MSRPGSMGLVLAALGSLLGGWGSCGGEKFNCTYSCLASEGPPTTVSVTAPDESTAQEQCTNSHQTSCADPECTNCTAEK